MRQWNPKLFYAVAVFAALSLRANAMAVETTTVPGNVSTWATTATRTGSARDDQAVDIAVYLTLHDIDGLRSFVADVSKPGTPAYGNYLSTTAFRARFAPDVTAVNQVEALLRAAGMANVQVGPAGVYVAARATVKQLRSTFGVTQDTYAYGATTMRANREAPILPATLAGKVVFIEGLDDSTWLKHPNHKSATEGDRLTPSTGKAESAAAAAASAITPPPVASNNPSRYCSQYFGDSEATLSTKPAPYDRKLPWLVCGYTPQQIQQAYGLDRVQPDGTGVTVAIIDAYASPTLEADGNQYALNHSLPALTNGNFKESSRLGFMTSALRRVVVLTAGGVRSLLI